MKEVHNQKILSGFIKYLEENGMSAEEFFKEIYPYSKNKKEWPTLGDFRKAVIGLGLIYVNSSV